jgi:hypothetical protein
MFQLEVLSEGCQVGRYRTDPAGTGRDIGDLAQRLLDRKFTGKAVLHLGR